MYPCTKGMVSIIRPPQVEPVWLRELHRVAIRGAQHEANRVTLAQQFAIEGDVFQHKPEGYLDGSIKP